MKRHESNDMENWNEIQYNYIVNESSYSLEILFFNQEHVKEDIHYLTCFLAGDPNLGLEGAALLEAVFIHVMGTILVMTRICKISVVHCNFSIFFVVEFQGNTYLRRKDITTTVPTSSFL